MVKRGLTEETSEVLSLALHVPMNLPPEIVDLVGILGPEVSQCPRHTSLGRSRVTSWCGSNVLLTIDWIIIQTKTNVRRAKPH